MWKGWLMVQVRSERAGDHDGIRRVNELAFEQPTEADLVDALRDSDAWLPEFSLVAEDAGQVVGHALFTIARLDGGAEVLSLAPMAVLPGHQRSGIGGAMVREGLERARATDYPLVAVLGHAEYYPRFGFEQASAYGITTPYDVPDEVWMVLPLPRYDPSIRGEIVYPPAFDSV
jgi:putative acetyltransferase